MSQRAGAGSWTGGGPHADILAAEATDNESRIRIAEECKARAKGAFSAKDMMSAEALWTKSIDCLKEAGKPEAALYSNRAMARLNIGKLEESLSDANECLKIDKGFVKAFFRKGTALQRLKRFDDAKEAYEAGKALEPSNKAWQEALDTVEKDIEKEEKINEAAKKPAEVDLGYLKRSVEKKADADAKRAAAMAGEEGEDLGMRGYKKTSDGKTTSYFHTEISDEAKKLIGSIAPKKIEEGAALPIKPADPTKGSEWNQAGTYEEKGMTTWCKKRLAEALCDVKYECPNGLGTIKTLGKLKDEKGDAQISSSRGKRRYIFDFSLGVEFEADIKGEKGSGTLKFAEISSDCDAGEYEVSMDVSSDTPPSVRPVLDSFVKNSSQGLQPLLFKRLKEFVDDYHKQ